LEKTQPHWDDILRLIASLKLGRLNVMSIMKTLQTDDRPSSLAQAETLREECRSVSEGSLKLRLNMDKTSITHVNDGFIFLGHRIIRKRSRYGDMRVVSTIPKEKARNFAASLTAFYQAITVKAKSIWLRYSTGN
jgi:Tn3 transposase DDE domain